MTSFPSKRKAAVGPSERSSGVGLFEKDARDFAACANTIDIVARTTTWTFLRTARSYSLLGIRQQRLTANQAQHLSAERRGTGSEIEREREERRRESAAEREREREGLCRRAPFVTHDDPKGE